MEKKLETINTFKRPTVWKVVERRGVEPILVTYYQCPTCRYMMRMAPRCPECGQLVTNLHFGKVHKQAKNKIPVLG